MKITLILNLVIVCLYFILSLTYNNTIHLENRLKHLVTKYAHKTVHFPHQLVVSLIYFLIAAVHLTLIYYEFKN